MYLFGGCRNRIDQYVAILYQFDPETLTWYKMKPLGFIGPNGRERHCGVIVGDCAYIFSGVS